MPRIAFSGFPYEANPEHAKIIMEYSYAVFDKGKKTIVLTTRQEVAKKWAELTDVKYKKINPVKIKIL